MPWQRFIEGGLILSGEGGQVLTVILEPPLDRAHLERWLALYPEHETEIREGIEALWPGALDALE